MTELTKLKKLIKLAKDHGLSRIKSGDMELEFAIHSAAPALKASKTKPDQPVLERAVESDPELQMPNDDEMLFYSTDSFDSLRKSREVS